MSWTGATAYHTVEPSAGAPCASSPDVASHSELSTDTDTDRHLVAAGGRAKTTRAYQGLNTLTLEVLAGLPVTEKFELRDNPGAFRTTHPGAIVRFESSGTTGPPTVSYRTCQETLENAAAVAEEWRDLVGGAHAILSLLDHNSAAAGVLIELIAHQLGLVLARSFPYGPAGPRFGRVAATLSELRPEIVVATPSELLDLEEALLKAGAFDDIRTSVRFLLLLGAPATPAMCSRISANWDAVAMPGSYGSTEVGTIATGCRAGSLHVLEGRFVLEVRDAGSVVPLSVGSTGELIVTPLHSEATALIRYATGDTVSAVNCPCGRHSVALMVSGRADDQVLVGDRAVGPAEVEDAVFRLGGPAAADYFLEVGPDDRIRTVRILPLPGREDVDLEAVATALQATVRLVDRVPSLARAGGAVKSWRRTRVVVRSGDVG
jgi:phenylacetate-CoA ligase